ncbi:MAG: DUF4145 domain-containing protein [Thermodesulfovibrionales bacterium]|nr:DUF4145 domain-containing protein [Thermodesulfovibrionales bacterium]
MRECKIDDMLISKLREFRSATPQAVATDLMKFNQISEIDFEMAIVRARKAVDLMLRSVSQQLGIVPGTKPIDQLLVELTRAKGLPPVVERHCRVVKDFGNLAAHGSDTESAIQADSILTISEAFMCAESTMIIARWYCNQIAPQLPDDVPFRVLTGKQVSPAMIDQALAIDAMVYPEQLRGIQSICYSWLDRNPEIYTLLIDPSVEKVIGYINAMPLEPEYYKIVESGKRLDVDFPAKAIRLYDLPDFYFLYFCSIAIDPSYHSTTAFKALYNAFIDKLLDLAQREFYITEILADAVTEEGNRLCQYAGMRSLGETSHNSQIFKATLLPPSLRVTSLKAKKLTIFYQKKYEEFRDLLK